MDEISTPENKKPLFLRIWLIIMAVDALVMVILNFSNFSPISIILGIAQLFFLVKISNWKKYGFYGIIIITLISILLLIYSTREVLFDSIHSFFSFGALLLIIPSIEVIVLYYAMKPVWHLFN